jgi:hypothetical protein
MPRAFASRVELLSRFRRTLVLHSGNLRARRRNTEYKLRTYLERDMVVIFFTQFK